MKSLMKLGVLVGVCVILPGVAWGAGGQSSTAGGSTTSWSRVTVTIPSVIGIDVETDVAIDFSAYLASAAATTGPCPSNIFPPPAGCTGDAVYLVNGSTTTATAPVPPAPNTGNIWMAVFSNRTTGTLTLSAQVEAAWNPASGPGFPTTDIRTMRSAANNTFLAGNAVATKLTTAATSIGIGSLPATFNWSRVDQFIDLSVGSASTVTFNNGTFDADVTFTIAK